LRSFVSVLQELKDIAKPNCFSPTELKVEFSIMNTTNNDFFSIINVNDTFKIISITFAILMMAALLPFLAGIVWFERFGSDKKRTLINMLVVSIILTVFQCGCLVQTIDIIRYLSGPWSEVFCLMQAILRSSLISDFLLYYDAIIIIRYLYIFILKNPAAFQDEFWYRFINIWIKSFSLIFQGAWHILAIRQPIGFYICCGRDPSLDNPRSTRVYGGIEIFSLLLHMLVYIKIKRYKQKGSIAPEPRNIFQKGIVLVDIESNTLATFAINFFSIFALCLTTVNVIVSNRLDPKTLNEYPNHFFVYYVFLVSPTALSCFSVAQFYFLNKQLLKSFKNELKLYFFDIMELFLIKKFVQDVKHRCTWIKSLDQGPIELNAF
jgi:hypothetical protein